MGVTTRDGQRFAASRYVSNVDPRRTAELAGGGDLAGDAERLRYEYSCGTLTLYLGLRGLDLRDHGFGSFNVWHYPHDDISRMYDDQLARHDLDDPWLFLSTPTPPLRRPGPVPARAPDPRGRDVRGLRVLRRAPRARPPRLQRREEAGTRADPRRDRGALRARSAGPPGDAPRGHPRHERALLPGARRQRVRSRPQPCARHPRPSPVPQPARQPLDGQRHGGAAERRWRARRRHEALRRADR